ncbi:hydrogenase maturation protease [Infirmifilum lucidum]|uniref:Hydrogenase maturation protease n=1 Tax=Infirmifilum lucidum TaxID=2776706 RepID=A0A7L9FGL7_9CREN|nr:hydrogenase maturation protease [Infirmifilum lucidum]
MMYGDDAIGPILAEGLSECGVNALPAELDVFSVVSHIEESSLVIFIDVLDESFGQRGRVVKIRLDPQRLSAEDIVDMINWELSAHKVTPAHLIALAYASGGFSGEAWIIGPVASNFEFGTYPSEDTLKKVEDIISEIEDIVGEKIDRECVVKKVSQRLSELRALF